MSAVFNSDKNKWKFQITHLQLCLNQQMKWHGCQDAHRWIWQLQIKKIKAVQYYDCIPTKLLNVVLSAPQMSHTKNYFISVCGYVLGGGFASNMYVVSCVPCTLLSVSFSTFQASKQPVCHHYVTSQEFTDILFWCKFEAIKIFKRTLIWNFRSQDHETLKGNKMFFIDRNIKNIITFNRSMYNIYAAIRNASFLCQFHDEHGGTRVPFRWFHDHCVAANQCHRKHLQWHLPRVITVNRFSFRVCI